MAPKAPYKGRSAREFGLFLTECLSISVSEAERKTNLQALMLFLVDIDADCLRQVIVEAPTENPTGLLPEAMVEKMDVALEQIIRSLTFESSNSEDMYMCLLDVFEHSLLKLHQPNYIQFVFFRMACGSKERSDHFLSLLLNVLHDDHAEPVARREAVGYIVSFAVRCKELSWLHSARAGKYLVAFMHSLQIEQSVSDRQLFVICLQGVIYLTCWESDRWRHFVEDPTELGWISSSAKSLVSLLEKHDGVLQLVDREILTTAVSVVRRVSVEIADYVSHALERQAARALLPVIWQPLVGSDVLSVHFPFESECVSKNLHRSSPLLLPCMRQWVVPAPCADASSKHVKSFAGIEEGWNFHPLTSAYSPLYKPTMIGSPAMAAEADEDVTMSGLDLGPNLVLHRIITSDKFAKPKPEDN